MHIALDGTEVEVTIGGSACVGDLAQSGYWIDGRYHPPTDRLELYAGASVTTYEVPSEPSTAYVLDIVGGLHSGRTFPLPRRRAVIGRATDYDIVLDDPTISPRHAIIDERHRVIDLGSLNGSSIDGGLIVLGATQARIRPRRVDTRTAGPLHRPPRAPIPGPDPVPTEPTKPSAMSGAGLGALVGPALIAVALVLVYGDPRFALIAMTGPALALIGMIGRRRKARRSRHIHRGAMRTYEGALVEHFERECQRLDLLVPDPCEMTQHLWARRESHDDFGLVRLGMRGAMPVVADALHGSIGIVGDRSASLSLARSLVCQVAAHHGPADVCIEVERSAEWDWANWLPHQVEAPWTFSIATALSEHDLPAHCTAIVTMTSDLGDAMHDDQVFVACGMDEPSARAFARWLARFEDPEAAVSATLPRTVALSTLDCDTGTPIGVGKEGVVEIDLVRDGPHGLISGTTGSGKSELLRTLVAGLAARHTPEEMVFVLVDYKGGSAFDECSQLPHCVGLVTDLDEQLGERALRSLEAELRFRERSQRDGSGSLPRLVVLVDEFATMAAELPDFLGALVGIAQRGRSLGMHLLLATQRPAGAVNANIKANANLRIALRVQDAADSIDVIDSPEAASISRDTPGRAYIRRGPGDVVLVQTAIASLPAAPSQTPVVIRPFPACDAADPVDGPTELALLVERLRAWDGAPPRRPWLPMLPERIDLAEIDPPGFAMADEPDHQRQVPVAWQTSQGNLALYGMAGSGTTTAMRAVVERLPRAEIYEVVFGAGAPERHARLMRMLRSELERRRAAGIREPLIVTCIDDVGAFLAEHDNIDGTEVTETFHRLFSEGSQYGITFVVTADRVTALPLRLSSLVSQKLLFRLADPQDYALVGLRPKEVPAFVPGRAIHSEGSLVVQVGLPGDALRPIRARKIHTMPAFVSLADLPPGAVGIDEDLEPVFFDLVEHALIAGPPRSGKTTALRTIARVLPRHLIIDDAAQVDTVELARPVVAAARTDDVRSSYGHWLREVRKSRTGLLLQPDLSTDGDLLGVRLPRRLSTPLVPGRGFLVDNGEARLVQIATPEL
jgi:DNA segregation ATPase FtsK/SpoIIIE-like protein